ncbi:MAG: carboxypeptidase M32, partial [Akkermansiaceae bacterium]|nr:carboxypeptidase M32 [Akkermansiaceae bacterium]
PAAVPYRARQLAYLSKKAHQLATSDRWRAALEAAETEPITEPTQPANLREFRHQFDRATRIPDDLVERETEISSKGKAAWIEARRDSDFATFAPFLTQLLEIAREKADLWGYRDEPYDALLEEFERGASTTEVAELFDRFRGPVAELAREAVENSKSTPADLLDADYPIEDQKTLNREIAESIGFDFQAGRIDTVTHPFCTGLGPNDTRLTTRYEERDFLSSLFGVMHEAGHGLYDQGLPEPEHGLPSGDAISLGIHESQSRLWENHIGRARAFWERWLPRAADLFPNLRGISLDDFLCAVNRAEYSCIRVEADEATYDLHILLRFSLERRLLNRDLEVAEVPEAWNDEFESLFGFRPPDDARGCLQDIHWSMGGFGYFSTYSIGNLNAAQLHAKALENGEIAAAATRADYAPLLTWMQEHIHARGSTLLPQDLMESATGERTNPEHYLGHLRRRFAG